MLKPKLILLDLDGTLVDSIPDLAYAIDVMMTQLDLPTRGVEAVSHWVGNGVERLVKRALTGDMTAEPAADVFAQALSLFMSAYADCNGRHSQLYPGVREGLTWLHEECRPLVCITNKSERFVRPLLTSLDIADYFDLVIGGDTLAAKKPDPLPLTYSMQQFQKSPLESLMIGDSINDVQAARAAGCQVICVSYGYNHGQNIYLAGANAVIDNFLELPGLLMDDKLALSA